MRLRFVPLLLVASCVSQRPLLGHAELRDVAPLIGSQSLTSLSVTLQRGRVIAGPQFDLVADDDGCLRGHWNLRQLALCPAPADEGEGQWYRSNLADGMSYGFRMLDRATVLQVQSGRLQWKLRLGKDKLSEAVREMPELVAAVFAYGLVPPAKDGIYELGDAD